MGAFPLEGDLLSARPGFLGVLIGADLSFSRCCQLHVPKHVPLCTHIHLLDSAGKVHDVLVNKPGKLPRAYFFLVLSNIKSFILFIWTDRICQFMIFSLSSFLQELLLVPICLYSLPWKPNRGHCKQFQWAECNDLSSWGTNGRLLEILSIEQKKAAFHMLGKHSICGD